MSRRNAIMAMQAFATLPSLIYSAFADRDSAGRSALLDTLERFASSDPIVEAATWATLKSELSSFGGAPNGSNEKPFAFSGGVAVIPVYGVLINRFGSCWGFVTGYNFVVNQARAAAADPDVTLIVYDYDSPGGMSAGCQEAAAELASLRDVKPSIAVVDSMCCSAAYWMASSAGSIWATPSSIVGSIGCYLPRFDFTGAYAQMGVKVDMISKGDNKLDSNPMVAMTPDARARLQEIVDQNYESFVAAVAENRSDLDTDAVTATQASCYTAKDALSAKLIDGIGTAQSAIESAAEALVTGPDEPEDDTEEEIMDQAALNAAVAADRTRTAAIMNCAEAAERPALAKHLALGGMSLEDAQGILKAAAPEVKPAASTETPANPLPAAMAAHKGPGVEADSDGNVRTEKGKTRAEAMCAALDKATGTKLTEAYKKAYA